MANGYFRIDPIGLSPKLNADSGSYAKLLQLVKTFVVNNWWNFG
jgi:hypothetical protein